MTEQKNLQDFYESVMTVHSVMQTTQKSNERLFEKNQKNKGQLAKIKEQPVVIEDTHVKVVCAGLTNDLYIAIINDLFKVMHKNKFEKLPSVNQLYQTSGSSSRYDKLAMINLYDHTLNCVFEMRKILFASESHTPNEAIAICLIIAILHDFGKCPSIERDFKTDVHYKHHKTSAMFAKDFLQIYKKKGLNDEIIDLITSVIFVHHDLDAKQNIFLKILKQADSKAREIEMNYIASYLKHKNGGK